MVEAREQLCLALEASAPLVVFEELFREDLQRHDPVDTRVPGPVHLSHSARAKGGEDLIGSEASPGRNRQ